MNLILDSFLCRCFFFFYLLPGLSTPTSSLWRRSSKANHTSTLSCNCEYFSASLPRCSCRLPHAACHMPLIALPGTLTCAVPHTNACTRKQGDAHATAMPAREHQWGCWPSHLHPVSLPPTPTSREMSCRKDRSGSGALLTERLRKT